MKAEQILRDALDAHAKGRIDEAEILYKHVLEQNPKDPVVFHHRGILCFQKKDFESAARLIRKAILFKADYQEAYSNLGNVLREQGKLDEAIIAYREAIRLDPKHAESYNSLGSVLTTQNELQEAMTFYDHALRLKPQFPECQFNRGLTFKALGKLDEAIAAYRQAVISRPNYLEAHFNLGIALMEAGCPDEAVSAYHQAIALRPDFPETYFNLGVALTVRGQRDEAIAAYRKAVSVKPDFREAYLNLGVILADCGLSDEAIDCYRKIISILPNFAGAYFNLGIVLASLGRSDEAIEAYRQAISLQPDFPEPYCSLGLALVGKMQLEEAVSAYQHALALRPNFYEACLNLGVVLRDLGRREEAIEACRKVVTLRPDSVDALVNLGTLLRDQGKADEALNLYQRAVAINPNAIKANAQLIHLRRHLCEWAAFDADQARLLSFFSEVEPFVLCTADSTLAQQLAGARTWASRLPKGAAFAHVRRQAGKKIRIGYLSADYHRHATAYLIAELVEKHDRSRFEIVGYSYGADDGSEMRKRLAAGFDRFVDLEQISHINSARHIHDDEIDILVDLKGYTGNARTEILVDRPAPIQVNYLGFPGTMGADFIDYIIADSFVAPQDCQAFYSEKIVHLPDCYQPNDTTRIIPEHGPTRQQCGLPERSFVFCSFNGAYKITPPVFDVWMRLLKAVPDSVLWLLSTQEIAEKNLRQEAQARGVDSARLIFCPALHLPMHLARHRNADLFLDTLPVNAHTTASDALWAGLPVLTCAGNTFIGRVAGSLLTTLGLPELVTSSFEAYEALALDLALNPSRLAAIRQKLIRQRQSSSLFDIARYTRSIENAYMQMHEIYGRGENPRPIIVNAV